MSPLMRWHRVTHCANIPLREGRAVSVGNREIAIFNLGQRFLAIENRCPHRGGPLADGIVAGTSVVCPLHGWKLSLETGKGISAASAASCVPVFPTRVEDGIVLVELPLESSPAQTHTVNAEHSPLGDGEWSIAFDSNERWTARE